MDLSFIIVVGVILTAVIMAGSILLLIDHKLEMIRNKYMTRFIDKEISVRGKKVIMDILSDSMDSIPGKIAELKKEIEGE